MKRLILLISLTCAFVAAFFSYGFFIGTKSLHVNEETIRTDLLPASFNYRQIAVFSDLYLTNNFSTEQLNDAITEINAHEPIMTFFLGDVIDMNLFTELDQEALVAALTRLEAPAGKFFTLGEHDLANKETIIALFERAGFIYLEPNQVHQIYFRSLEAIQVATFDPQTDPATMQAVLSTLTPDTLNLVLHHFPDSFAITQTFPNVFAQFSGHSLGGQINVPGLRSLLAPAQGQKFPVSVTTGSGQSLYVNQGLGNQTDLPIRLFNAPSITIYTLEKTTPAPVQ